MNALAEFNDPPAWSVIPFQPMAWSELLSQVIDTQPNQSINSLVDQLLCLCDLMYNPFVFTSMYVIEVQSINTDSFCNLIIEKYLSYRTDRKVKNKVTWSTRAER